MPSTTHHDRLKTTSNADWSRHKSQNVMSELTPVVKYSVLAIILVTSFFIVNSILFLHTASMPALRAAFQNADARKISVHLDNLDSDSQSPIYSSPHTYAFSLPRGDMCFLKEKLTHPEMPTIHSIFADSVSNTIVSIGVRIDKNDWRGDEFVCEFEGSKIVLCDPVINDDRRFGFKAQYVIVITCPIPRALRHKTRFTLSMFRRVNGTILYANAYRNVTACLSGSSKQQRGMIRVCTMLKDADDFLADWIAFHRYVGVDHIFIYDNQVEEISTLRTTVASDIENGFVTVIPWAHQPTLPDKNYLEVQIAHENDCLWRNRHASKWMIKIDVDEYVQPMNASKPRIADYLTDPLFDRIGAARLQNWFFGRPNISTVEGGISLIHRNQWRSADPTPPNAAHDKNILRPINVHYFKIHGIKLGGPVVTLDPWTQLRLVHYRADNPRKRSFVLPDFSVHDSSMADKMAEIAKSKSKLGKR